MRRWGMDELTDPVALQAATQQSRYDFLQNDLALCLTFLDLMKTERELGDMKAAQRLFGLAEQGYATITRFLPGVQNPEQRNEIEQKLTDLRARLDVEKMD